jgi:hypothetical protein
MTMHVMMPVMMSRVVANLLEAAAVSFVRPHHRRAIDVSFRATRRGKAADGSEHERCRYERS